MVSTMCVVWGYCGCIVGQCYFGKVGQRRLQQPSKTEDEWNWIHKR